MYGHKEIVSKYKMIFNADASVHLKNVQYMNTKRKFVQGVCIKQGIFIKPVLGSGQKRKSAQNDFGGRNS
ncbi:MAG: hypothetical protein A3E60_02150 [Candidatus Kerfeldbacteria bacterium RIFCSPHIGHO2_12_FULL_42_13]|nr:MAG: hypothetical protein A3E60_02150 [Candidatus Kerfeldbacteria bacterium RIFCSPHIGHO2_12_FULL_42_13]